jgi:hypothetical protein
MKNRMYSVFLICVAVLLATLPEKPIRADGTRQGMNWSQIHAPAANSQATTSRAAATGVRHVAYCVGYTLTATTAPAATSLNVVLRDGATGAGTIIWQHTVVATAGTGNLVTPHTVCGLNIAGTAGTAMTLEFSAGLTNAVQVVSLTGYTQ